MFNSGSRTTIAARSNCLVPDQANDACLYIPSPLEKPSKANFIILSSIRSSIHAMAFRKYKLVHKLRDVTAIRNLHCLLWQPIWYAKMVVHCRILQVTVSKSIKPVITSKLHRKMTKYEEKVHVFLTKAHN